jgi:TetR/AcrR family transcriptional repressor of bet genes
MNTHSFYGIISNKNKHLQDQNLTNSQPINELQAMAASAEKINRRALAKERRRQQLIDATIKCISKKGLGSTTLADVAREAGLSQGIVNLHFNSKDNLLSETLLFLAEEYDRAFTDAIGKSPDDAATRLLALMEMDLKPAICDRQKLAVWFSFWGEVRSVPTYQKICAAYDDKQHEIMVGLTEAIIREGSYADADARTIAEALSSLTDGLWLSYLVNPKTFDRNIALNAVLSYLYAVFPKHYPKRNKLEN